MNDGMNRRTFIIELAALGAFAAMPATSAQEAKENHINAMMAPDPDAPKVSMLRKVRFNRWGSVEPLAVLALP